MSVVVPLKGYREAPKAERSAMETLILTPNQIGEWRVPPFQRPVRVNQKVATLAEAISGEGGIITGVITLGRVRTDNATYIVDGQHRLEAFRISGLAECIADVRFITFDSMAEMADEFVRLNTALVRMRPDDILRGLESSTPSLAKIRRECRFVGYDQIRRGTSSPIVGMSMLLRCWQGSLPETPVLASCSATVVASQLTAEAAEDLVQFLIVAEKAWGRDAEYARLWNSLNMGICMWLWRRLVKDQDRQSTKRYIKLTIKQFTSCLMALSADGDYRDWLGGRKLSDGDRGPAYTRIKRIWSNRLAGEIREKIMFPQTVWGSK